MEFIDILIDTHAHLNAFSELSTLDSFIKSAKNAGIEQIWDIGTDAIYANFVGCREF